MGLLEGHSDWHDHRTMSGGRRRTGLLYMGLLEGRKPYYATVQELSCVFHY